MKKKDPYQEWADKVNTEQRAFRSQALAADLQKAQMAVEKARIAMEKTRIAAENKIKQQEKAIKHSQEQSKSTVKQAKAQEPLLREKTLQHQLALEKAKVQAKKSSTKTTKKK